MRREEAPHADTPRQQVRLSACAARVFVEADQATAGTEALVFEDGTCFLQQNIFLKVLKTYKSKPNVIIEADGRTLRFYSTTLPITDYSPAVTPPGKFCLLTDRHRAPWARLFHQLAPRRRRNHVHARRRTPCHPCRTGLARSPSVTKKCPSCRS